MTETTRFCAENGGKTAIKTGEPTVARLFDECQDSMRQIQRKLLIQSSNHDDNYILAGILFCALVRMKKWRQFYVNIFFLTIFGFQLFL